MLCYVMLCYGYSRLHPNNVIGVRSFGDQFMCASLVEACSKYVQKYFVDVARSEEFLSLEQKDVVEILSNDELHVSSEEQVVIQLSVALYLDLWTIIKLYHYCVVC